jgi:hypothetical protein
MRERGGIKFIEGARHTFFPDADNPRVLFSGKEDCIEFLKQHLQKRGCPAAILSKLIAEVREWSDK